MQKAAILILLVGIIQLSYACYITNCPIGGKRSLGLNNILNDHQVRSYYFSPFLLNICFDYISVLAVESMANALDHQFAVQALAVVLDIDLTFINAQLKTIV